MNVFAIADLHLSFSSEKPMGIFGDCWDNHAEKIKANWIEHIHHEDLVLIAGDISWAMTLDEVQEDLNWLGTLPGKKILIKGNHDYWWNGIGKVRSILPKNVFAIQNDSMLIDDLCICGTRGWQLPSHPKTTSDDIRLYAREVERLKLSLLSAPKNCQKKMVMLHYPPLSSNGDSTEITELLEKNHIDLCIYGHLHAQAHQYAFEGFKNGIEYRLTSADYLDFSPVKLNI
ncbi:hypothetical protein FY534_06250 [Alicyclobacillus sp. TC]|uniref:Calcineurin-like phosphoesterase domain-containing protein n=1 Tax=Alicyclobacillus tolerans TaxID=90970 RepID=A0A1M6SDX3_9BACL|nr:MULTISPECIES: metallophosphoesterase [Alicyclobacillus]QRF23316.1 hypothetical protein FY534_06250 [Alicyclobacillus sp. TC]SHK42859.1 hypothetical protein SAMN05443507_113110 [Alicyclobacillus montanus]